MGGIKDAAGDSNSGIALFDFVESRTSGRSYVKRSRVGSSESDEERLPPPRLDCPTRAAFSYRGLRKAIRHRGCFVPGRASNRRLRATGSASFFFFTLICFCFFSRGRHHRAESAPGVLSIRFLFIIIIFCRGVSEPRGATERSISRFPSPRLCFSLSFSSFAR